MRARDVQAMIARDVQAMREETSEPAGANAGAGGVKQEEEAMEDDSTPPTSSRHTGGGGGGVPHDVYLHSNAAANTQTHTQHNPVRPAPWGAERQERAQGNPAAKGAGGRGGDSGGWQSAAGVRQSAAGVREVGQHMSSNVQIVFPLFCLGTLLTHMHAHVVIHTRMFVCSACKYCRTLVRVNPRRMGTHYQHTHMYMYLYICICVCM
jgi:hypothetical protein